MRRRGGYSCTVPHSVGCWPGAAAATVGLGVGPAGFPEPGPGGPSGPPDPPIPPPPPPMEEGLEPPMQAPPPAQASKRAKTAMILKRCLPIVRPETPLKPILGHVLWVLN